MREFNNTKTIESLYRQDQLRRKETKSLRFEKISLCDNFSNRRDLVSLIAYCLNPNHYHLLIKQIADKGIEKFMHKLGLSYTQYFNAKNNRSGSLFQGPYKSAPIKTDAQLLYISAYINGNHEIHKISNGVNKISKADEWKYSSYLDYLRKRKGNLCNKKVILDQFENIQEYKDYIKSVIKNSKEMKEEVKKSLLE